MRAVEQFGSRGKALLSLSCVCYLIAGGFRVAGGSRFTAGFLLSLAASVAAVGATWTWNLLGRPGRGWALAWVLPFALSAIIAAVIGAYVIAGVLVLVALIFSAGLVSPTRGMQSWMDRLSGESSSSTGDPR